jgi:Domain of unknown function (DUF4340)
MNFKTTYYLFGGLVLVVVIFALGRRSAMDSGNENVVFPTLKAANVKDTDITYLEIDRPGPPPEKLVFERPAGTTTWRMTQPSQARVESSMVDEIVRDLVKLRRDEKASAKLPRDLKSNGLEPPTVTIIAGRGQERWKLDLGNESPGTGRKKMVYVVSSDRPNEPMAIAHQDVEKAYKNPKDFRDKVLVLESPLNALDVTLSNGKTEISLAKVEDPAKVNAWNFVKPPLGEADWEGEGTGNMPPGMPVQRIGSVRDMLVAVEQMRVGYNPETKVDDFVADNVSEKDLGEKYGLAKDNPATLRIAIKRSTGTMLGEDKTKPTATDTLLIGKKVPIKDNAELLPEPKAADDKVKPDDKDIAELLPQPRADDRMKEEPSPADDKYYARLESENNVVQISGRNIPILLAALANPDSIRNKDLAVFDVSKVDAIDIKSPNGKVTLRKLGEPEKWRVIEDGNIRDADAGAVAKLLNMLTIHRQVKEFPTAPDDKLGLDDKSPTADITIWENGIKDKKDVKADVPLGKETVKLVFATKPDKEVVYVKRIKDKNVMRVAVAESMLPTIVEGKLGYLDRTVPVIGENDEITKIVAVRREDGTTFEMVNEKAKPEDRIGVWKIVQPTSQAGRKVDPGKLDTLLFLVRTLRSEKLVAEKATDKELADWGLKPAAYEITVTVKKGDKTEDRVFLFGQQNEKKDGRYAKGGDRDLVFLVRPEVIDPIGAKVKDFADLQVLDFDPAKVRELKLIGLADGDKRITLDLESKETKPGMPRTWVVKNEADLKDFKLDPTKPTGMVNGLSHLLASGYLAFKTGPKSEYKLDEKNRALEIEITLEGEEKKPQKLFLGALVTEGDLKGYAAQTEAMGGDIVVIPEGRFADLLKEGLKNFGKRGN